MKKILIIALLVFVQTSCKRKTCISCIAEGNSGKIVQTKSECDKSLNYLNGYKDGLKQYYKNTGDSVQVHCTYMN